MFSSAWKCFLKQSVKSNFAFTPMRCESSLSKLRKLTGYPLASCRNALSQFKDDVDMVCCFLLSSPNDMAWGCKLQVIALKHWQYLKAAKWLEEQAQKEGWVKADKLKDRKTSQGLLGFLTSNESLTVVELNCETDFVAKSDKFHSLLHTITDSLSSNLETTKDKVKSKFLR